MLLTKRMHWDSRLVFLLAAIGSAIGLGNIWRFPYLTYKFGGGAFLIPYLIALLAIGIPLLLLEFGIGQKMQRGAIGSFTAIKKNLGFVGFLGISAGFMVVSYYAVVMAWAFIYFIGSFQSELPWAADPNQFFFQNVLQITDSVNTVGSSAPALLVALAVVWVAIFLCVFKGVKSVGRVVLITMPLPVILLVILMFRSLTLDGALAGIAYYITPDFSLLLSTEIWLAAISQIFFTLSLGFGIMIAYASYNKKTQSITRGAFIVAGVNSAFSLLAGFVVFGVLGHMAFVGEVPIEEVVQSGPSLAFIAFPQALGLLPLAGLFSILFFMMLLALGIDSAFSLVESVNTTITDVKKKWTRVAVAFGVCLVGFLAGIIFTTGAGLYFLDIVDHFVTSYSLVLVGILQCIAVGWIYGAHKLRKYINSVSVIRVGPWWDTAIKWVIPLALSLLFLVQLFKDATTPYEGYPAWAIMLGWLVVLVPLALSFIFVAVAKKS